MFKYLVALSLCLPLPAMAANWVLLPKDSTIAFSYTEDGAKKPGEFTAFNGKAEFDPAAPETASVSLTIRSASIDLRDPIRSHFARSADWFDADVHPTMEFRLSGLTEAGPNRYMATGNMLAKGTRVAIAPQVELVRDGNRLRAKGSIVIDRHDFQLGIGFSSLFVTVGRDVVVTFDLIGEQQ